VSTPSSAASASAAPAAAPKPVAVPKVLSNWPTRPDIDLLFVQLTKFAEGASTNTAAGIGSNIGGGGGMSSAAALAAGGGGGGGSCAQDATLSASTLLNRGLDYAAFCDALFLIAETKYKALIAPSNAMAVAGRQAHASQPHENVLAAFAAGCMTPLQAFLHFVDVGIRLPEDIVLQQQQQQQQQQQ